MIDEGSLFESFQISVKLELLLNLLPNTLSDRSSQMKANEKSALPGFPWKGQFITKDEINQYFSDPDGIQCLLCGRFFNNLSGHLNITHDISHEQYRARYGLPWRKGLVSRKVSKKLSSILTKRIKNGSFKPNADNKACVEKDSLRCHEKRPTLSYRYQS